MVNQVINLKERTEQKPAEPLPAAFLEWFAYDREPRPKKEYWFLWPGAIALILMVFSIFARSYFFLAFVLFAFIVFMFYATREPRKYRFAVKQEGFFIDEKLYPFSQLKSFWVFDTPRMKELSLETSKILFPYLHIPLGSVNSAELKETLKPFLSEKEHPLFLTDQIVKRLGL